ncbi:ATP-binding cassette domain-containing protein [Paraglaciecola arctica]|uniref:ATP-binding cassette domain-containing protein n=1 Tax=Paraglaciecola arctica TaxID=1128911 RepID=UPI001C06A7C5|nr:ATP-binding cassette domain-containing protein [Paraglaciecola arctica]MBU3005311.1 ATP-binding cassette domain-containing protein [Paraglaciecola arctica]
MLKLESISKTYADGTQALINVSMEIGTGMVGLLGPNGAGKSSLMRTIATLQSADSGTLLLDGENVSETPNLLRRQLGYLPQHFGVYPHISCRGLLEHLAIMKGLNDRRVREQQIEQLLSLTNLTHMAHRQVRYFSGGMLQRFGVAQALLGDPKVLILDEPTSGLDPAERLRLHAVLHEVAKTRMLLLSTHIVEDIEHLCGKTYILLSGEIVANGVTSSLFESLEGKIWQGTMDASDVSPEATILSQNLHYGVPVSRVYAEVQPNSEMKLAKPCLQDRYFLHLNGVTLGGDLC